MVKHAEIKPDCFYDQIAVRSILGITAKAIGAACRENELRYTERASRRFFRGQWLIDWLEGTAQPATPKGDLISAPINSTGRA